MIEEKIRDLTPCPGDFEAIVAADRLYFEEHPSAWHYVRPRGLSEVVVDQAALGHAACAEHTLVVQVVPGFRFRMLLAPGTDISDKPRIEAFARAFLAQARRMTGGWTP